MFEHLCLLRHRIKRVKRGAQMFSRSSICWSSWLLLASATEIRTRGWWGRGGQMETDGSALNTLNWSRHEMPKQELTSHEGKSLCMWVPLPLEKKLSQAVTLLHLWPQHRCRFHCTCSKLTLKPILLPRATHLSPPTPCTCLLDL